MNRLSIKENEIMKSSFDEKGYSLPVLKVRLCSSDFLGVNRGVLVLLRVF